MKLGYHPFSDKKKNKWDISLALCLSIALLTSCSTSSDSTPPRIDSISADTLSIFDTLSLKFTESLREFDSTHIKYSPALQYKQKDSRTLLFWGNNTHRGHTDPEIAPVLTTFLADTTYEIIFENLQDESGNEREKDTVSFRTFPHPDSQSNDEVSAADTLGSDGQFYNKTPYATGQTFTGVLEGNYTLNVDNVDQFALAIHSGSKVSLSLSGFNDKLKLIFKGPVRPGSPVEEQVAPFWSEPTADYPANLNAVQSKDNGKEIFLEVNIDANRQAIGLSSEQPIGTPLIYWIEVKWLTNPADGEIKITPYKLFVKIDDSDAK